MKKVLAVSWFMLLMLAGCQEEATLVDAEESMEDGQYIPTEDVVTDRHGKLTNEERFTEFLTNLAEGKTDQIRITMFTTEGDPIYQNLAFDGNKVSLVMDSRKDKNGSGEITEMTCTTIEKNESSERIDYILEGCSERAEDHVILTKWKE